MRIFKTVSGGYRIEEHRKGIKRVEKRVESLKAYVLVRKRIQGVRKGLGQYKG